MPFAARRAIILAAGRGERLLPLTENVPKPLLCFDGMPIIERIVARLLTAGIGAITVVVGYKAEQFVYLVEKYPFLKLHYNSRWSEGNNVLSVYSVIDQCENALIVNGDAIIVKDVLRKDYEFTTMYADRSQGFSKEWELQLDKEGFVDKINLAGGVDILQQREITFICENDFKRFKQEVKARVEGQNGLNDYFEFCLLPWCKIAVCEVPYNSIFDLDTYKEWIAHPLTDKSR